MRQNYVPPESQVDYQPPQDSIYARSAQREKRSNSKRSLSERAADSAGSPAAPSWLRRQWTSLKDLLYRYSYFSSSVLGYTVGLSAAHTMAYTQDNVQVSAFVLSAFVAVLNPHVLLCELFLF